ncbi:uncharacterized protein PRCAT00003735001 [Priceomyces carsonii]|uniref:uncharacterized protein n=1 Tax=Priceomyces carsonii TaxID=28549 RepID=UPI002EDA0A49|nr:unnamed protein product [Priceomyces carsonii]
MHKSSSMSEVNNRKTKHKGSTAKKHAEDEEEPDRGLSSAVETVSKPVEVISDMLHGDKHQSHSHHHGHHRRKQAKLLKKRLYESRRVIFVLGALIGLLLAAMYTTYRNPNLKTELDKLVNFDSVSDIFEDWKDMIPSGIYSLIKNIEDDQLKASAESFSVGRRMVRLHNLTNEFNVVMVPGVISTGIESWGLNNEGDCPSVNHFRKRLWGSFYMLRTMIMDKNCWLKHIMLDPETGLDPPNIKLRAAQGFEAADFFMAGYWIWNKLLENLAVIGYGPNNMLSASYDWRLTYLDLEKRDKYFSKLKAQIEMSKDLSGVKTILVGHSMGSQVIFYFMKWVEAPGFGNGGPRWCNDFIEAFVDISGTMLGAPKSIPAMLSGEMKDTVQLNALAVYGLEKFFSKKERVEMVRTFGGVPSMIPKGGDLIWGNLTNAPDDPTNTLEVNDTSVVMDGDKSKSFGTFINLNENGTNRKFTVDESIDYLLDTSPEWFSKRVKEHYSFGVAKTKNELVANNYDHSKWSNPLEVALPNAPDMKVFCFYGVGKPTERAYTYKKVDNSSILTMAIDLDLADPVYVGDGDGTVSLLSHTNCHEWKKGSASRYNPGNSSVVIVEIKDEPDRFDIRGGAKTADHVDILGSAELNELVLKVAAGRGDLIKDRYVSNLKQIVEELDI